MYAIRSYYEVPDNVKKGLDIVAISTVDEVLEHALVAPPVREAHAVALPPPDSASLK